jgi:hypothetical protein
VKSKISILSFIVFATVLIIQLTARAAFPAAPAKHPVEVKEAVCSECHPDKGTGLDHTTFWSDRHAFTTAHSSELCIMCHSRSYCTDCHAKKEELKPSTKYKVFPSYKMPHRGDYITRHKIDAKIDPAPCFKCHGRGNNAKCKKCHR